MTLIKSISGIRGTIGGVVNDNLTPIDAVKFAAAYGIWLNQVLHTLLVSSSLRVSSLLPMARGVSKEK